jgi:hypothetical protein
MQRNKITMTYETYQTLFLIFIISAGVLFVLSVVMFFLLKIPNVIGYLNGKILTRPANEIPKENLKKIMEEVKKPIIKNTSNNKHTTKNIQNKIQSYEIGTTVLNDEQLVTTEILTKNKNRNTFCIEYELIYTTTKKIA